MVRHCGHPTRCDEPGERPGRRIRTADDRHLQLPAGHVINMPFAVEAEVPVEWECHCGEMALLVDAVKPEPKPVKPVRTHWDMLLERRTIADLEELLEERLALLEADDDAGLRSA